MNVVLFNALSPSQASPIELAHLFHRLVSSVMQLAPVADTGLATQKHSQAIFPFAFLCLKYAHSKNPLQLNWPREPVLANELSGGGMGSLRGALGWLAAFLSYSPTHFP